jgi:hypothetical protein
MKDNLVKVTSLAMLVRNSIDHFHPVWNGLLFVRNGKKIKTYNFFAQIPFAAKQITPNRTEYQISSHNYV